MKACAIAKTCLGMFIAALFMWPQEVEATLESLSTDEQVNKT